MDAASVATIGGMRKGGFSGALGNPSCGGSRGIDVCQRFLLAHSVPAAWGEPARPGFPPEGETGKGEFRLPCRRQFARAWRRWQARRWFIVCSLSYHVFLQIPITNLLVDPLDPLSRSLAGATHSFAVLLSAL